jgi:hypothetical protein
MMMVPFDPMTAVANLAKSGINLALGHLFKKRELAGFKILEEEFKSGETHPCIVDPESFAGMAYRYNRAVCEGTARVNLRTIARLMAHITSHDDIVVDEFIYYADVLASLRREELVFLVKLHQTTTAAPGSQSTQIWKALLNSVVPSPFNSKDYVTSLAQSVSRSGFVIPTGDIGNSYKLSPIGQKIIPLTKCEAALEKEAV